MVQFLLSIVAVDVGVAKPTSAGIGEFSVCLSFPLSSGH